MDHESEVIHHQMEETRASLSEKLETLENKVVGTVKETTQAVTDTVETVKETFNLRHQFDRHPWVMLGGSAAVGMGLGLLLSGQRRERRPSLEAGIQHRWEGRPLEPQSFAAAPPSPNGSWLHRLASSFEPELHKLKGLALGTLFGTLRDLAVEAAPKNLADKVREVANRVTTKMGGEVIHGPVWQDSESGSRPSSAS